MEVRRALTHLTKNVDDRLTKNVDDRLAKSTGLNGAVEFRRRWASSGRAAVARAVCLYFRLGKVGRGAERIAERGSGLAVLMATDCGSRGGCSAGPAWRP